MIIAHDVEVRIGARTLLKPSSFQVAPNDREGNFATYTKPLLPLAPQLVPAIAGFLTDNR